MVKDFVIKLFKQMVNFIGYPQAGELWMGDVTFLWETLTMPMLWPNMIWPCML